VEGRCCPCQEKPKEVEQKTEKTEEAESGKIEKFFGGPWNDFVNKFKIPIIVIFVIWIGASIGFASQLSPLSRSEEFLSDDHPLMEIQNVQTANFVSGGVYNMAIDIYWGVEDIDKSDTSMWDPVYIGEAIMDENFDLSPPDAQQSLIDFCTDLPTRDFILNKDVTCWMDQFKVYVETTLEKTMPLEQEEFKDALYTWAFEVPEGMQAKAGMLIGFSGEDLVYMKVKATGMGDPLHPYDLKNPWFEKWQAHLADYRTIAPSSMQNVYQNAGQWWAFMPSEKAFLSSAF